LTAGVLTGGAEAEVAAERLVVEACSYSSVIRVAWSGDSR
jgi:hypothetical protein